eukprot:scaffold358_cov256-Pinguiococcus_pyrenoidosus.AAC.38
MSVSCAVITPRLNSASGSPPRFDSISTLGSLTHGSGASGISSYTKSLNALPVSTSLSACPGSFSSRKDSSAAPSLPVSENGGVLGVTYVLSQLSVSLPTSRQCRPPPRSAPFQSVSCTSLLSALYQSSGHVDMCSPCCCKLCMKRRKPGRPAGLTPMKRPPFRR